MPPVIAIAGFLGAWLLVAGPVYQAAVELDAEQVDRAGFDAIDSSVPPARRSSPWWWLLPPVAFARQQRAARERRMLVMRAVSVQQLDQLLSFGAKATGWLLVGTGGALIAVKETWELVEALEWQGFAFWLLVPAALVLSLLYAVTRLHHDHRMTAIKQSMLAEGEERSDAVSPDGSTDRPRQH